MKVLLIPALVLATVGSPAPVRFEADGIRVGSDLVTGPAMSLKEAGSLPLLVSGSVLESLSGEALAVDLGQKQIVLGSGLRLVRAGEGYRLSTHGMPFTLTAGQASLTADREVSFMLTEKGFNFGALGTLDGVSISANVLAASTPAVAVEAQQDPISPESPSRQMHANKFRRVFQGDPMITANAVSSWSVRMIPRVTPDGSP